MWYRPQAQRNVRVLTVSLEPYLSSSASFPPPFDFILRLFLHGSKMTSGNFAFIECSEHMILEEEQAPLPTVPIESQE